LLVASKLGGGSIGSKILQRRNIVLVDPHDIVIIRNTRPRTAREGLAVLHIGPTHIFAACVDGIAQVQWLLPFAIWILLVNQHIISAALAHVRTRHDDNEALLILGRAGPMYMVTVG
jgi:hypothetical protein